MKIFVAGGTGVIGSRLVPLLKNSGYQVFATTRSPEKCRLIETLGAVPVLLDVLDRKATIAAVLKARPDVVVHQLTAIPSNLNLRRFDSEFAATNLLRTTGTMHLLEAAKAAGTKRFVAQSFAGWPYARSGAGLKTENDPLDPNPAKAFKSTLDALKFLENAVLSEPTVGGIVLRYGGFYGPGCAISSNGEVLDALRKRMMPIVGKGTGVWSFLHIDDAASATLAAIEGGPIGIYNITDDDPAPVSEWLPFLAHCAGAKPPLRIPKCLGRLVAGEQVVILMNEIRGVSNAKAKEFLHWRPSTPSWREGFTTECSSAQSDTSEVG